VDSIDKQENKYHKSANGPPPSQAKPLKDSYKRFIQRHDPKWAAMIALLAHNDVN